MDGDLISRSAPMDSLGASDRDIYCKEIIEDAPGVDAVPVVHARWIDSPNIPECVVCSNCMSDGLSAQVLAPAPVHYRFCPCCGARMDGEEINGT